MLPPEELWEQTKEQSGISKTFFDAYFSGRKIAYAYKLGKVKVYEQPKDLIEFGLKSAPQSFVYIGAQRIIKCSDLEINDQYQNLSKK